MNLGRVESMYQRHREAAEQHDTDRNFRMALEVHAKAHGLAEAMVDALDPGENDVARGLWRIRATYHANRCEHLRTLVTSNGGRDSDAVERAVWGIVRLTRALIGAGRVTDQLPGYIQSGLTREFKALDVALAAQRDARH